MRTLISIGIVVVLALVYFKTNNTETQQKTVEKYTLGDGNDDDTIFIINNFSESTIYDLTQSVFLGQMKINKILKKPHGFLINISPEDYYYKMAVRTRDFLVISYAFDAGEDRTIICDYRTNTSYITDDFILEDIIGEDLLYVMKDYYDSLDMTDPNYRGHIFEHGTYNLRTKEYTFKHYE